MKKLRIIGLFSAAALALGGCVIAPQPTTTQYQPRQVPTTYQPQSDPYSYQQEVVPYGGYQQPYIEQQRYPYGYQQQPELQYYNGQQRNFLGRTPYGEPQRLEIERNGRRTIIREKPCTKIFGCS